MRSISPIKTACFSWLASSPSPSQDKRMRALLMAASLGRPEAGTGGLLSVRVKSLLTKTWTSLLNGLQKDTRSPSPLLRQPRPPRSWLHLLPPQPGNGEFHPWMGLGLDLATTVPSPGTGSPPPLHLRPPPESPPSPEPPPLPLLSSQPVRRPPLRRSSARSRRTRVSS